MGRSTALWVGPLHYLATQLPLGHPWEEVRGGKVRVHVFYAQGFECCGQGPRPCNTEGARGV